MGGGAEAIAQVSKSLTFKQTKAMEETLVGWGRGTSSSHFVGRRQYKKKLASLQVPTDLGEAKARSFGLNPGQLSFASCHARMFARED